MSNHDRISEILLEAGRLPPEERTAFLDRVCAGNAALRAELDAALAEAPEGDSTLAFASTVLDATIAQDAEAAEGAPTLLASTVLDAAADAARPGGSSGGQIGPYRLVRKIGEGGMGEVWLAEQVEPVRRQVALKIIKAGMDTHQVVARFEAERQALALMDHPAIAKVLDAGTTAEGRPYFVMEHIDGVPITEHCDAKRLTNRERIALLVQVCEGVQHAHQKAIIHRDLKPSNVLVTMHDGRALPKIIDFGVAKATSQRLTEKTMFTEMGAMIGTPEYMSPEQTGMMGEDVDTRTDVYALGVILYELLVGALPFDPKELRRAGYAELVRRIREDEPPRPSTRLITLGDASGESANRRRVDLRTLRGQLRSDLDWITMKALEKDRARRYGSPSEMAADLVRHLKDEPVLAGAPSVGYRARKFVRRNRIAVVTASIVLLALALGIVGTTVGMVRARRAQAEEKRQAAVSERVAGFMSSALGNVDVDHMGQVLLEDLKTRGAQQGIGPELAPLLSRMSGTDTARRLLGEEIVGRAAKKIDVEGKDDPLITAGLENTIALTFFRLGFPDAAEPYAQRALAIRERLHGPNGRDALETADLICSIRYAQGRFREAEALARKYFEAATRALGAEDIATLDFMSSLAVDLQQLGRYDESEKLYLEAVAIHRRKLGPEDIRTIAVVNDLGFLYEKQGRFAEAEPVHRANYEVATRVLAPNNDQRLWATYNLGWSCLENGKIEEAARLIDTCMQARLQVLGREHQRTIMTLHMKARVTMAQGRHREARDQFREEIELWKGFDGGHHPEIWWAYQMEAHCSYMLGDLTDARREFERCVAAYRKGELPTDITGRMVFVALYDVYKLGGWIEPARQMEREMLPVWRRQVADGGAETYTSHLGIALALLDEGHGSRSDAEEALREVKRCIGMMLKENPSRGSDDYPDTWLSVAFATQALAEHVLGNTSEAVAAQRLAVRHFPSNETAMRARIESDLERYRAAAGGRLRS